MKNPCMILTLLLLTSCGGQTNEAPLTMEEEQALADSIANALETEKVELTEVTEESVQEIDSLLETL